MRRRRRRAPEARILAELTPRELEVFELVARGLTNPEIAAELIVRRRRSRPTSSRILMKLGLRDRVQAVIYAYQTGLWRRGPRPVPGTVHARGHRPTSRRNLGYAAAFALIPLVVPLGIDPAEPR